MSLTPRLFLIAFTIVSIVQLVAVGLGDEGVVRAVSKALLMPLLLGFVVTGPGLRLNRSMPLLAAGLVFAFVGDVALLGDGDVWFLTGMLGFLVMQLCYLTGFFRLGARQTLRERRWVMVVYPLIYVIAIVGLASALGVMVIPIAIYGFFLMSMAMTSMSLGTLFGVGGTLFMLSDALIGVSVAFGSFPGSSFIIMATYIVAQYLIVSEWIKRSAAAAEQVPATPSADPLPQ